MSATGLYRAVRIAWTNPSNRDLAATEIWGSQTNNRATAALVHTERSRQSDVQLFIHPNLTPGTTWYYWVRAEDTSGNLSGWMPSNATSGWSATVSAVAAGDLPKAVADGSTLGVAAFVAADFNDNGAGVIALDYTNGQAADASHTGYLLAADWSTFAGKVAAVSDTFTITGTGFVSNPTGTARYLTLGLLVALWIPELLGTSNDTAFTLTGLPAGIRPTREAYHGGIVGQDNSVLLGTRMLRLNAASSTITLYADGSGGAWTNSGTKSFGNTTLVYALL